MNTINLFDGSTLTYLTFAVAWFLPLLSSLIARPHWPGEVVGGLTIILAAVTGFCNEWIAYLQNNTGGHYDWRHALGVTITTVVFAFIARIMVWAGTKTDAWALAFGSGAKVIDVEPVAVQDAPVLVPVPDSVVVADPPKA